MTRNSLDISRRTALKNIGGAVAISGLAGCSGDGSSGDGGDGDGGSGGNAGNGGTTTGSSGNGGGLSSLRVSMFPAGLWDTTMPLLIGTENGFFEEQGIDLEYVEVSDTVRAAVLGDVDISWANGVQNVWAAYQEGIDVRLIANETATASDLYWYTSADSEYESLEDLTDAAIGYSVPGSSTHMVTNRAVDHAGLDNSELVSVGGPPDAYSAFQTGEVDLGWAVPPFFYENINNDELKVAFRGNEIPPFDEMTVRGAVAGKQWLNDNPDLAEGFLQGMQTTFNWVYDNLDEATQMFASEYDIIDADLMKQGVKDGYPRENFILGEIASRDSINQVAYDQEFVDKKLTDDEMDELIDTSYAPPAP